MSSTVKLNFKKLLNKEQTGNSEPFRVTNLPVDLGMSINDVPRFLAFFDLPTYLCPIWSLLEKAAYLMTSFFV